MYREMCKGTKDYADEILLKIENSIRDLNTTVETALQTIEESRKELK